MNLPLEHAATIAVLVRGFVGHPGLGALDGTVRRALVTRVLGDRFYWVADLGDSNYDGWHVSFQR